MTSRIRLVRLSPLDEVEFIACAIVALAPRLHLAAIAALEIPAAIAIAKILARAIGEFALGETSPGAAFAALAVGVAIGYLITRDRSSRRELEEETESTSSQGGESFSAL